MKKIIITGLLLVLSTGSLAATRDRLCVLDPARMPESWRPPAELRKDLNPAPWSVAEAKDAAYAKKTGVDEMISLFKESPTAVPKMFDDAIAALMQVTYSSANTPEFDAKVRDVARDNLTALLTPYLKRQPETANCDEFEDLLPLAIFAHRLYPAEHELTSVVTKRVNAAYRTCGSLETATENILRKVRRDNQEPDEYIDRLEDLFDLYAWSLLLIEAELYPDIELPDEARAFGPKAWKHFEALPLPGVSEFDKGVEDERFITLADLATHLAHIPTGLHRFPLYVEDKPDLYRLHRENFYPMMQSGDRDLFALFVDTLRQYGCTPENDVQVRDGTRYLLDDFHKRGDRWMTYSEQRKTFADPIEYIKVHHAWTAVLGVRDRNLEPPEPGTYGSIVRRWLPPPRSRTERFGSQDVRIE
jgi:hypothetical protein